MDLRPDIVAIIALLGVASFACRAGGFLMMRAATVTPRVEAWLKAMPIAVIGAILGPIAVRGGPAEWLGLAAAIATMRFVGNDFLAAAAGIGTVALVRATGWAAVGGASGL